ncbi:MAG: histidinol-phosphatase [bacterium]|nr:histidinol phosphatase [Gammaproteobacteria bacterium]HIL98911.1 histidinol phosphatase [Pseudomonadales bacterium]
MVVEAVQSSDTDHLHNFHTHTYRCKHATGDVADYCQEAVNRSMQTLGFSDHSALPDDRWIQARMHYADLSEYTGAIDQAKVDFPTLTILKGMECEYIEKFHSWYEEELLGELQFDYLIGASHFFTADDKWVGTYGGTDSPERLRAFADYTIGMMATGLFDFIAHPDLFGNCYLNWDADAQACSQDILQAAADLDVGMEINALGLRKQAHKKKSNPFPMYPWLPFWELATDYDVKVIVNSDAHRPEDLQARTGEARKIAEDLQLNFMDLTTIGRRNNAVVAS